MDIYKNETLKEQITKLNILKEKYSKEANVVNSYFWPLIAAIKKKYKNELYYTGSMFCLLVIVLVIIILGGIKNEYWIYSSIGVSVALIIVGVILSLRTKKKKDLIFSEYDKNNKPINDIKEEIRLLEEQATSEVPFVICYNENYQSIIDKKLTVDSSKFQELLDEVKKQIEIETSASTAFEDVIGYYNEWADKFLVD